MYLRECPVCTNNAGPRVSTSKDFEHLTCPKLFTETLTTIMTQAYYSVIVLKLVIWTGPSIQQEGVVMGADVRSAGRWSILSVRPPILTFSPLSASA